MTVVPVTEMYVDANFKEGQLAKVRVGQAVKLHADLYGKDITYKGQIEGFSGGSGAAFSAIPAQNATGNWIKVVQRLPVRIKLDPAELLANPLKVGLSMSVEIDTRGQTN
jgi:membrane fusion protein (multidrug efflux system)